LANDALLLSDIDAYYGDSHVLHRVSLHLGEGRLLGLLGRNGAGKSTSMNVEVGWLPPRPKRSQHRAWRWCRRAAACSAA
jgi:branched-chain amino acid transport system ATP-binding protein